MADATVVDKFAKVDYSRDDVDKICKKRTEEEHAKSCVVSGDSTNWILTTVWPGDD